MKCLSEMGFKGKEVCVCDRDGRESYFGIQTNYIDPIDTPAVLFCKKIVERGK